MKISINAPSYKRPKVDTLKYLPFCKIWVCETEYEEYKENNKGATIIPCKKGIQGNVSRIRNHILDTEFNDGADAVVIIDDDLKGIYHFEKDEGSNFGYVKKLVEADDFIEFVYKHSIMAKDLGAYMWGVNINKDALVYRHSLPINTVAFIGSPFTCHLKGSEPRYDERLPLKEDYDITLQHLNKYRVVLRMNKYHYNCKQSQQVGGCAVYRNYPKEKQQFEALQKKWGSDIVREDKTSKKQFDYNPIIKIPILGV